MFERYFLSVGGGLEQLKFCGNVMKYRRRQTEYQWRSFFAAFHHGFDLAVTGKIKGLDFRDYTGYSDEDAA